MNNKVYLKKDLRIIIVLSIISITSFTVVFKIQYKPPWLKLTLSYSCHISNRVELLLVSKTKVVVAFSPVVGVVIIQFAKISVAPWSGINLLFLYW